MAEPLQRPSSNILHDTLVEQLRCWGCDRTGQLPAVDTSDRMNVKQSVRDKKASLEVLESDTFFFKLLQEKSAANKPLHWQDQTVLWTVTLFSCFNFASIFWFQDSVENQFSVLWQK